MPIKTLQAILRPNCSCSFVLRGSDSNAYEPNTHKELIIKQRSGPQAGCDLCPHITLLMAISQGNERKVALHVSSWLTPLTAPTKGAGALVQVTAGPDRTPTVDTLKYLVVRYLMYCSYFKIPWILIAEVLLILWYIWYFNGWRTVYSFRY